MTDCSNYVVGIFQNNELHITPLKTIIEMKPQFDYLEKGDKRAKDETKTTEEGKIKLIDLLTYTNLHRPVLNLSRLANGREKLINLLKRRR